jgi:Acetyltransferases, including N-acetylases of ribosomal proteins
MVVQLCEADMAVYNKILLGKTVKMRAIEETDAEITYNMRNNVEKSKFLNSPPGSIQEQREYIIKQRNTPGDYYFIIEDFNGNIIGMKAFYGYCQEKKSVESGRFMGFGNQIQHIEALVIGFDFAFDILGVNKVIMTVIERNQSMYSLQKRMGAKETGRIYMPEFGCDSIHSELTRDSYLHARKKAEKLIERFTGRN